LGASRRLDADRVVLRYVAFVVSRYGRDRRHAGQVIAGERFTRLGDLDALQLTDETAFRRHITWVIARSVRPKPVGGIETAARTDRPVRRLELGQPNVEVGLLPGGFAVGARHRARQAGGRLQARVNIETEGVHRRGVGAGDLDDGVE